MLAKINFRINAIFLPIRAPPRDNFPFTVKKNIQNPIISKIGHHQFHQLPPYISFLDRAILWRGRKRKRKKKFLWKRERVEHLKLSREYVINGEKKERWQKRRGTGKRNDRFSGALTDDNPRVNIINRNECNRAGQQPSRGQPRPCHETATTNGHDDTQTPPFRM